MTAYKGTKILPWYEADGFERKQKEQLATIIREQERGESKLKPIRPKRHTKKATPEFHVHPPPAGFVHCAAGRHWHHKSSLVCPQCADTREFDTSMRDLTTKVSFRKVERTKH